MKALKAFIRLFEAPQRSAKIKISVNFYFTTTFWNEQGGKVKCPLLLFEASSASEAFPLKINTNTCKW